MMRNLLKLPYSFLRPYYEKTDFHNAVISQVEDTTLRQSFSYCRAITRKHAKTFYMATRFLPYPKQRSIFAIYGLCRYLDNLVDNCEDLIHQKKIKPDEIRHYLDHFRENLLNVYCGTRQKNPVLQCFADVISRYNIPRELPLTLLEGVEMDLVKNRYNTFDELYEYSYKAASVVGLMTSEVFGYEHSRALGHAVDLGIAMQLTNILRDVGEDLEKGRIYLPKEDLDHFDISEEELFAKKHSAKFTELMKFEIERARTYYKNASGGIELLNKDSRLPVMLAKENYSRILNKIEENGYDVFNRRAFLSTKEKLAIFPKVMLRIH